MLISKDYKVDSWPVLISIYLMPKPWSLSPLVSLHSTRPDKGSDDGSPLALDLWWPLMDEGQAGKATTPLAVCLLIASAPHPNKAGGGAE